MKRLYKIGAYWALVIFLSYQICMAYFTHSHAVGKNIYFHFHPYSKTSHHTHTLYELVSLDAIFHFIGVAVVVFALALYFSVYVVIYIDKKSQCASVSIGHNRLFRGPPVVVA